MFHLRLYLRTINTSQRTTYSTWLCQSKKFTLETRVNADMLDCSFLIDNLIVPNAKNKVKSMIRKRWGILILPSVSFRKAKSMIKEPPCDHAFCFDYPKKLRGKFKLAFEMISPILRMRVIEGCWIKDGYALNNGSIRLLIQLMKKRAKHHTLQSFWFIHYALHPPKVISLRHTAMRFLINDKPPSPLVAMDSIGYHNPFLLQHRTD